MQSRTAPSDRHASVNYIVSLPVRGLWTDNCLNIGAAVKPGRVFVEDYLADVDAGNLHNGAICMYQAKMHTEDCLRQSRRRDVKYALPYGTRTRFE